MEYKRIEGEQAFEEVKITALLEEVVDSGGGIDDTIRDKVFRPFFTTRPDNKGTGLGLATPRRIARLYGGGLALQSAAGRMCSRTSFRSGSRKYRS